MKIIEEIQARWDEAVNAFLSEVENAKRPKTSEFESGQFVDDQKGRLISGILFSKKELTPLYLFDGPNRIDLGSEIILEVKDDTVIFNESFYYSNEEILINGSPCVVKIVPKEKRTEILGHDG